MPEIPEIETVRNHLERCVRGKEFNHVTVNRNKALNVPVDEFVSQISGQVVTSVRRRAKQIIIGLANGISLVIHFMLEGYVRFFYPHEEMVGNPSLTLTFTTNEQLSFFKINLGYVHLAYTTDLEAISELADLGPEPLSETFTLEAFLAILRERKGMIKPLLMEQQFIAGIGNVYSNEVLFCSGILPTRKITQIDEGEQIKLYHCIRNVLQRAIELGGVYEEKFASDDTLTGGYEAQLQVAYRTGKPCYVCGHEIVTERVGGRNAFYCPVCQK
jgi:formamidopyrimidine-DNA glycosylase